MDEMCLHDFIAPETKPEHAICAKCGSEPKYVDYSGTMTIRYLPVKEWVDIALTCVTIG